MQVLVTLRVRMKHLTLVYFFRLLSGANYVE